MSWTDALTDDQRTYLRSLVERDVAGLELVLRLVPDSDETHMLALTRQAFAQDVLADLT